MSLKLFTIFLTHYIAVHRDISWCLGRRLVQPGFSWVQARLHKTYKVFQHGIDNIEEVAFNLINYKNDIKIIVSSLVVQYKNLKTSTFCRNVCNVM